MIKSDMNSPVLNLEFKNKEMFKRENLKMSMRLKTHKFKKN